MRFRAAFLLLLLILRAVSALSQADTALDGVVGLNSWGISFISLITQKNKIQGERSQYNINSSPQSGMEAMINYFVRQSSQYSLIYSIGGGIMAHNFSFSISKEQFDPPLNADMIDSKRFSREPDLLYLKAGAAVQRIFAANVRSHWVTAAGGMLAYSPTTDAGTDYTIVNADGSEQTFLSTEDNYNNHKKPWANFHIDAGRQWRFHWGHIIQVMFRVNFSPAKFFSGTYTFKVGNQPPVSGRYGMSGSYIGINVSYVFSRYKKVKRE